MYDGDTLIAEMDGSGAMTKRYLHGPGVDEPLAWFDGASIGLGNRHDLFANHQASIVSVTDGNGVGQAINRYDEYGIASAGAVGRFQYTGQAWIPELGLSYYKARMYSPKLGRFMQTDPVGYDDQINLYAYVGNDPVNKTDPTGMCAPFCTAAAGAVIGGFVGFGAYMTTSDHPTFAGAVANVAEGGIVGAVAGSGAGAVALIGAGAASHAASSVATAASEGNLSRYGETGTDAAKIIAKDAGVGAFGAVAGGKIGEAIAQNAGKAAAAALGTVLSAGGQSMLKTVGAYGANVMQNKADSATDKQVVSQPCNSDQQKSC